MVPVPIIDRNKNAQSFTHLQVTKPYIALNSEMYISLRIQELEACKKIGYEYYREELFVVKHRSQHNCESAIYFDSNDEIIKENCEFQYFYNKTDVKPAILDRGNEIILANWPKSKYVTCKDNHECPIKIPRHPYVLLKRSVLCNCDIHAEEHSLLESIATCPDKQSDMTIYYTVTTAFMPYLDTFKEELELPRLEINQNWTTQKQVLPISLQATPFDSKLLKAPETPKGMVQQYKQKNKMLDNTWEDKPKDDFFDNIAVDIFLFVTTIISMLAVTAIIHLVCRHSKLKALLTGIAFQPVNQSRSSNQTSKRLLYSSMVHDCSLNRVDNIAYCIHLFIQPKMYFIQKKTLFKYGNHYVVLFRHQAICSSKIMQISRQYSFVSDLWSTGSQSNNFRKELSMGHDKDRLERSLCDFEWHNSKNAKNSQSTN